MGLDGGTEDLRLCQRSHCPRSLPAAPVFPPTLRESAWGPFAIPSCLYLLCLFLRKKKNNIIKLVSLKKEKKIEKLPPQPPRWFPPPCPKPSYPVLTFVQAFSLGSLVLYPVRRASNQGETLQTSFLIPPWAGGAAPRLPPQCKSCVLLSLLPLLGFVYLVLVHFRAVDSVYDTVLSMCYH